MDWFLYDNGLPHERVNTKKASYILTFLIVYIETVLLRMFLLGYQAILILTLWEPTPQNGQTHSKNSSETAFGLLERVWLFCGVGGA